MSIYSGQFVRCTHTFMLSAPTRKIPNVKAFSVLFIPMENIWVLQFEYVSSVSFLLLKKVATMPHFSGVVYCEGFSELVAIGICSYRIVLYKLHFEPPSSRSIPNRIFKYPFFLILSEHEFRREVTWGLCSKAIKLSGEGVC